MGGTGGTGGGGFGGAGSCGDGVCSGGETCQTCATDCGACTPCAHSECVQGAPLKATCSPCASAVCNQDPFCCSSGWDNVCTADADMKCGTLCQGTGGAGGASTTGGGGAAGAGLGGAAGSGVAGAGGVGGGVIQTCVTCAAQKCTTQLVQCLGNAQCQACFQNPTPSCITVPTFTAIIQCTCASCNASCGNQCP